MQDAATSSTSVACAGGSLVDRLRFVADTHPFEPEASIVREAIAALAGEVDQPKARAAINRLIMALPETNPEDWTQEQRDVHLVCSAAEIARRAALTPSPADALREALAPFLTDWRAAGMPDTVADEKLMRDAEPDGGDLTVGDWRRLVAAAEGLR